MFRWKQADMQTKKITFFEKVAFRHFFLPNSGLSFYLKQPSIERHNLLPEAGRDWGNKK